MSVRVPGSKITNYGSTRSGTGCFIAVGYPYGNSTGGVKGIIGLFTVHISVVQIHFYSWIKLFRTAYFVWKCKFKTVHFKLWLCPKMAQKWYFDIPFPLASKVFWNRDQSWLFYSKTLMACWWDVRQDRGTTTFSSRSRGLDESTVERFGQ